MQCYKFNRIIYNRDFVYWYAKYETMNAIYKDIADALIREGFHTLTEKKEQQGKPLDFRITPYSLNTKLSFKFDSLDHFIEFLKLHDSENIVEKTAVLQTTFNEIGLNPEEFFYVNFFEKDEALGL